MHGGGVVDTGTGVAAVGAALLVFDTVGVGGLHC